MPRKLLPEVQRKVKEKLSQFEKVLPRREGIIGDSDGTIFVPNTNYKYVWVRINGVRYPVFNDRIAPWANAPVWIGYDALNATLLQILGYNYGSIETTFPAAVAPHASTHRWWGGSDVVFIDSRALMPLAPFVSGTWVITINDGMYYTSTGWIWVDNATVDLTLHKPSTNGMARFVLIYASPSGTIEMLDGADVAYANLDVPDIPIHPEGSFPICAVRMYEHQTGLSESYDDPDIQDLRFPGVQIGGGGGGGGDTSPVYAAIYYIPSGGSQSFSNGVTTIVNYSQVHDDVYDLVTTGASWKFTAPSDGIYSIQATLSLVDTGTWGDGERCALWVYRNGIQYLRLDRKEAFNTSANHTMMVGGGMAIKLLAGDYIDIRVVQYSGGSLTNVTDDGRVSWFSIHRVASGIGGTTGGGGSPGVHIGVGTYGSGTIAYQLGWQNFPFDFVDFYDTDGMHDVDVNPEKITINTAGYYLLHYDLAFGNVPPTWNGIITHIEGDFGVTTAVAKCERTTYNRVSGFRSETLNGSAVVYLDAGQELVVGILISGSGSTECLLSGTFYAALLPGGLPSGITEVTALNATGGTLTPGTVCYVSDGEFKLTTTEALVGSPVVVIPDNILDTETGRGVLVGQVVEVNLESAGAVDDYIITSGTAGLAKPVAALQEGVFGQLLTAGTTPEAIVFGWPSSGVGGGGDAADITYTPLVLTDWDGDIDPGNVDGALDQLAERVDDLEPNSHVPVTLAADADTLLGLTGQQITLDVQNANKVLAGPTTGADADPTFRTLVPADLGTGTPTGNKYLRDDLTWQEAAIPRSVAFWISGTLQTYSGAMRFTNAFGTTKTITKVHLAVDTPPVGASIIVDIHKNGTTIFTNQANRPTIVAGANSGYTTTIDVSTWADGDYLTMFVDQIGSTTPGSNLVVQVLFT